ncbi:putative diheme cytochrome c-type signal-peptide protein (plasmid) [Rhizobium favelukesii]|uniref:Diheme cytochrome c-type signal-peptide protein n=1 Tax=Rhizobium favelukesii TaxID=348824 RepID=W6RJZ6_9HYPH|nr:c-type cytochrome [Rhizobium favelukesii]CDM60640.1 putative diheme cytochrome c-type signal-peptide protein [Rhizobium favelukesii]
MLCNAWKFALLTILCAGIAAAAGWYVTAARAPFAAGDRRFDGAGDIAYGRLIFAAGDCASCHATPGQSDRLRLGGGMALASPFGTFRPPNISPDPVDGIGAWTVVDTRFAGGVDPQGTGFVPNITQQELGRWSESDFVTMLKSGDTPDHGRVGSSMSDVVTNTAMLPDSDRVAIARYIRALPPLSTPRH